MSLSDQIYISYVDVYFIPNVYFLSRNKVAGNSIKLSKFRSM